MTLADATRVKIDFLFLAHPKNRFQNRALRRRGHRLFNRGKRKHKNRSNQIESFLAQKSQLQPFKSCFKGCGNIAILLLGIFKNLKGKNSE